MRTMVIMQSLTPEQIARVTALAPDWEVIHGKDKERVAPKLKQAELVAGWNAAAAESCLQPDSKLRWVQNWGAGVDKLPLQAFKEKDITLTNASGVHAYPISETIFAMLLSFARKVHVSLRCQAERKWHDPGALGEIHGKTIGIIGVGAIGEETARLAKAFHMRVLGLRRSGEPAPYVDHMVGLEGLHDVLADSDYVVVTLPLTDETRHIFGRAEFARMKPTAVFINIGRGGTTDTEALLEALREERIAGAGLDVFEQEPLPSDHPLWGMEQVIITPHNSGSTDVYNERAFDIFIRNLHDYLQCGKPALNLVDLEKQY